MLDQVVGGTFRILAIPDVHAPYHSQPAWTCALAALRGWRPHAVVQLGDLNSFDSVTSHRIDPRKVLSLDDEIAGAETALDELDAACKAAGVARENRWMLEGNHEVRVEARIIERMPELLSRVDWRGLLHMDQRGWKVIPYKESLRIGELSMTHDVGRAGVNAARQSLLDFGDNLIFGHTHHMQVSYQGTIGGASHVGATLGWLGDSAFINYRHRDMVRRQWQHGFGAVHMLSDGTFWLNPVPIIQGRCILDGRVYNGVV